MVAVSLKKTAAEGRATTAAQTVSGLEARVADQASRIAQLEAAPPEDAARGADLERELRRLFDNIHRTTITDIGAALGVHGGPGTLIVATQPYSRPSGS